jgi:hypothetical protein
MNLRVRRVQEVFDILATTLWVVTAPKQEGRPARGLGLKGRFLLALENLYGRVLELFFESVAYLFYVWAN